MSVWETRRVLQSGCWPASPADVILQPTRATGSTAAAPAPSQPTVKMIVFDRKKTTQCSFKSRPLLTLEAAALPDEASALLSTRDAAERKPGPDIECQNTAGEGADDTEEKPVQALRRDPGVLIWGGRSADPARADGRRPT